MIVSRNRAARRTCAWLSMCAVLVACSQTPAPSYTRLEGRAPPIAEAPASPALLIAFWATWCAPCVVETPALKSLAAAPPENLRVVVISQDTDPTAVERFFAGAPDATLNLRFDPGGALSDAFRVERLPAAILTVNGRLVARFEGAQHWDGRPMRELLSRLTATAQSAAPQL